jgi:hypothetical protein
MATMRASPLLLVPFAALSLGCPWPINPDGPPCEDDVAGCSNNGDSFVEDPTCELTGDLVIELGEGEDEFVALAAGELPSLNFGVQGGQHVWLAVRVKNPALDRPSLKIQATMSYCLDSCDNPANWQDDVVREIVVGSRTLTVTDEGWFEQASILVILGNWGSGLERRVEVLVTDPCSRQGYALIEG